MSKHKVQFWINEKLIYLLETDYDFREGDKVALPFNEGEGRLLFEVKNKTIKVLDDKITINLSGTKSVMI